MEAETGGPLLHQCRERERGGKSKGTKGENKSFYLQPGSSRWKLGDVEGKFIT